MSALLLSLLTLFSVSGSSVNETPNSDPVHIDAVFVIGHQKTKKSIILRELSIKPGDTYEKADLEAILEADKSKLLNTRLFNTVDISIVILEEFRADIVVKVSERWYTFPAPVFELVDRNFNDWWQNQNRDLSRTNYGIKVYKNNFRGRNEQLRLIFQLGFTRQFGLRYQIPYIDKRRRHGLFFNFKYSENKNIAINTIDHKPQFFDSEELSRIQKEYTAGYQYRRSFYNVNRITIGYNENSIAGVVAEMNENYYNTADGNQQYFEASYSFTHDRRDFASYPLKGNRFHFFVRKQGIGIYDDLDRFDINTLMTRYYDLGKHFYCSNYSSVYASFPAGQPYANIRGLGSKRDMVRGYELFLIEGKSYYLSRSTLKKKIFSRTARLQAMPLKQFRKMPVEIFLKVYYDMAYVENFENYSLNTALTDRYLFGTGFGLDIVSYYDTVIRLEYSINREQDAGFFLHFTKEF